MLRIISQQPQTALLILCLIIAITALLIHSDTLWYIAYITELVALITSAVANTHDEQPN